MHGSPPSTMGGTGLYVDALTKAQAACGLRVGIVAPAAMGTGDSCGVLEQPSSFQPGLSPPTPTPGQRVSFVVGRPVPRSFDHAWRIPSQIAALQQIFEHARPAVVHIHHLSGLSLDLPELARGCGARVVLTLHDYALPCARGQLLDQTLLSCPGPEASRCARCLGPHLARSRTTNLIQGLIRRVPGRERFGNWARAALPLPNDAEHQTAARLAHVRRVLSWVDCLLSPSIDLQDWFHQYLGRRPDVCPLPLVHPVRESPPPSPGPMRLLVLGGIHPAKGSDVLARAFARLPRGSAILRFVGGFLPVDGHPTWAQTLPQVPGLSLHGHQSADTIARFFDDSDLLVVASRWPENSPLVVREAVAAGLPTLLPPWGGAHELDPEARRWGIGLSRLQADPETCTRALHTAMEEALRAHARGDLRRRTPIVAQHPAEHAAWLEEGPYRGSVRSP